MIRCDQRKISRGFGRILLAVNIPSVTAAAALVIIYLLIIRAMNAPAGFFKVYVFALMCTAGYSFCVTLITAVIANIRMKGHKKYTYMEILGQQIVVSMYVSTSFRAGGAVDYRRLWVIDLADVEEVVCKRSKVVIKGKCRRFETRADWLDYEEDSMGRVDFDYWWFSENGGERLSRAQFTDHYFYAERAAQRIIFCSQKQKAIAVRRAEFRKRMLEIAAQKRTRKKPKERVFRGYEIERKF